MALAVTRAAADTTIYQLLLRKNLPLKTAYLNESLLQLETDIGTRSQMTYEFY
ncbi:hypothetical protein [Herbaspirillum sp. C9C3]|uniref:hypothetical protein n=1 Tax=Herbaspirillum sp. C9C3 TaxID=2735271 RepID=UPI0015849184|nr:hypothetical protein [Herbaspirillum sp. C9C3]NUT60145.1 hypothetical protein [Herbaspirillum sp. C9C3]